MDFTMTRTVADTFTLTHAKKLASKVAADMRRCQGIYGCPSDSQINDFGTELAILLRDGYVAEYEFGYQMAGNRVVSWNYRVDASGDLASDDRPGKIVQVSIEGCSRFNQLTPSAKWYKLTPEERITIKNELPVQRGTSDGPRDGNGYWTMDRTDSSGGITMPRKTFQPYA
jgi:hypothetical protein